MFCLKDGSIVMIWVLSWGQLSKSFSHQSNTGQVRFCPKSFWLRIAFQERFYSLGMPNSQDILSNPPWIPDASRELEKPFLLKDWVEENRAEIVSHGSKRVFRQTYQSDVFMLGFGNGARNLISSEGETLIW